MLCQSFVKKLNSTVFLLVFASLSSICIYHLLLMENTDFQSISRDRRTVPNRTQYQTKLKQQKIVSISPQYKLKKFNNELFCPLKTPQTGMYKLLTDIYTLQFPQNCYDKNTKFWIYDLNYGCNTIGLFAMLNCWSFYFTQAFALNRTFLFHGLPKQYCYSNNTCFLLPVSNCNVTEVMLHYKSSLIELVPGSQMDRTHISLDFTNDTRLREVRESYRENVWIVREYGFHKFSMEEYTFIKMKYGLNNENEYEVLLWNFFLRLQTGVQRSINTIVQNSLVNVGSIVGNQILSMPIRGAGTDKCLIEMQCWETYEYMEIAKLLKELQPKLEYIVITSESKSVVENVTNYTNIGYKYITNRDDIMQGQSIIRTDDDPLSFVLSILSTLRMHFISKYFIYTKTSNWIYKIFKMSTFLECEPIKQTNIENEYIRKDKECIELIMPRGQSNTNETKPKIAILSHDLLSIYRKSQRNKTRTERKKRHKFGVVISNDICDRRDSLMDFK